MGLTVYLANSIVEHKERVYTYGFSLLIVLLYTARKGGRWELSAFCHLTDKLCEYVRLMNESAFSFILTCCIPL